jgi:hypothetical protein
MSDIFFEKQSGGLCRMHALNAFFGYSKISPVQFHRYIKEYDEFMLQRFNIKTSSAKFDMVNSDQSSLVSWILKQHKIHARYYALNSVYGKPLDPDFDNTPFFFMYNDGHIWGIRKKNNIHYKVDSISGVRSISLLSLTREKNVGFLLPVPLKYEWYNQVSKINTILDREYVRSKQELIKYLNMLHTRKMILGDLEIPMCVAVSILETHTPNPSKKFARIGNLINKYNEFLTVFTNGNYNDISLINSYVPDIIFELISLSTM